MLSSSHDVLKVGPAANINTGSMKDKVVESTGPEVASPASEGIYGLFINTRLIHTDLHGGYRRPQSLVVLMSNLRPAHLPQHIAFLVCHSIATLISALHQASPFAERDIYSLGQRSGK